MRSHVNERFRKAFDALPEIHESLPIFSVRIDLGWRAVGILKEDDMVWFWIGPHADYEKLIAQLRKR